MLEFSRQPLLIDRGWRVKLNLEGQATRDRLAYSTKYSYAALCGALGRERFERVFPHARGNMVPG